MRGRDERSERPGAPLRAGPAGASCERVRTARPRREPPASMSSHATEYRWPSSRAITASVSSSERVRSVSTANHGARGLVQYQFSVPDGQEDALTRAAELLRARRIPSYLGVLKRLGAASGGPLSFPSPGWTLALDIPTWAPGLWPTLDAPRRLSTPR